MTTAFCSRCGAPFHRGVDETWKLLCIRCFKENKRAEAAETHAADRESWRARYLESNAECRRLRAQVHALLSQSAALAIPPLDELREQLPRLLLCCHPDKHDGSQAATKATQYLLQIRARLSA